MLSPTPIKLAMAPLLWELAQITTLAYTAYAANVTMWTMTRAADADHMAMVQRGLDVVDAFPARAAVRTSPKETKYVAFDPGWESVDGRLKFNGTFIERTAEHTILCVHLRSGRDPTTRIKQMCGTRKQGPCVIGRVARHAGGLGERLAETTVEATHVFKVAYGVRFYKPNSAHKGKLEK